MLWQYTENVKLNSANERGTPKNAAYKLGLVLL